MENNPFDTSFIPELPKNISSDNGRKIVQYNLAMVLALVVFFSSIAVVGGLYYYRTTIEDRRDSKKEELANSEKKINLEAIKLLEKESQRLKTAKTVLDQHITLQPVFDFLEAQTAQTVGYTKFSYVVSDGIPHVVLAASASSYNAMYSQIEKLKKDDKFVKDVKLTGFSLAESTGIVNFTVDLSLDPSLFDYHKYYAEYLSPVESKPATSTPKSATTP